MKISLDNNSNNFITDNKKLSQITCYTFKLEKLCQNMQKQIDELNIELDHAKKQCELQKKRIYELEQGKL